MASQFQRFIDQARADYDGTPARISAFTDPCGEYHVFIECALSDGTFHYLDWIGGEYAPEPDEWGDEVPPYDLHWRKITT